MPHEHEWYLDFEDGITKGMCRGCPATLTLKEIEWLLNSQSSLEQRIVALEELFEALSKVMSS